MRSSGLTEQTPLLLEPTTAMPVTAQVRFLGRHHYEMEGARRDRVVTTGTDVLLARLIGLHRSNCHLGKTAHTITAIVARIPKTTMTTSNTLFSCFRNGLNPIPGR